MKEWQAFRPTSQDLERVAQEVAPIAEIQTKLVANCPELKRNDRVAHQYQIAGGKVELHVAPERDLPASLLGIGLFEPEAEFHGVGRVSTGQGCPHLETDPDFLA